MKLTIILPVCDEEAYLAPTLDSIRAATDYLRARSDVDASVEVKRQPGRDRRRRATAWRSKVVHEPLRNIARARNTGARHVAGDMLVFVDADVTVPPTVLHAIYEAMRDPACIGGGVDVDYRPRRFSVRIYLRASRLLGRLLRMVQGATQFCSKSTFARLGG